jgi:toxin ParE1/3/4
MKQCLFSPRARKDFDEILDFIGEADPDSALDFVTRLQLMCDQLAQMPGMGRKRDDLAKGLRCFPVEKYLIFYRIVKSDIEIVRVLHGSRNIEEVFYEQ